MLKNIQKYRPQRAVFRVDDPQYGFHVFFFVGKVTFKKFPIIPAKDFQDFPVIHLVRPGKKKTPKTRFGTKKKSPTPRGFKP